MKKMKLLSLAVLAFTATIFMASCDKTVTSTPLSIDDSETATVQFYAKADLDLTKEGAELLPAGMVVNLSVSYDDYSTAGTGTASGNYLLSDSTNADGYVTFTVPVDQDGVTANISVNSFEYDQVQADGSTLKMLYSFATTSPSIEPNEFTVEMATASISTITDEVSTATATLNLILRSDIDKTEIDAEFIPAGTSVMIAAKDSSYEFTTQVGADGVVSFDALPVSDEGSTYFIFSILPFVNENGVNLDGEAVTYEYSKYDVYYSLSAGQETTKELTISGSEVSLSEPTEMVIISGTLYAETDVEKDDLEEFSSKSVTFYNMDETWSVTIVTTDEGQYSISVPIEESIRLSVELDTPIKRTVYELDDNGSVVYQEDEDGNYILDDLGMVIPVTVDKYYYLKISEMSPSEYTQSNGFSYPTGEVDFAIMDYYFIEVVKPITSL